MKRLKNILFPLSLILGFISCQHKELFLCPEEGDIPINVIIHWDSVPSSQLVLPGNMTIHWYPASSSLISKDIGVYGGRIQLFSNVYDVMCMDFNGNSNIAFRSNGTRPDFEAYNVRMTGSYNINVPQLPGGELTVAEANPPRFYIDSRSQNIDTRNLPLNDTLAVHFYPKDVLREFTFLIYDVTGAKNMVAGSGAISGMSGSYWPATGSLASSPSTILFNRIQAIVDAQTNSRWTDEEKALFAAKNPDWASPDTLVGWTRDWVTGRFVTFGPLDREAHIFRLAVEGVNRANNSYYGSWGYWTGQAENSVAAQIDSAMGKRGTIEEQLAWRQRNGGYDIILYNDRRLVVPEEEAGGITDGGFSIDVDDWGEIIMLPTGVETLGATSLRNAPINTAASINNFVLNGFWNDGINHVTLFNAQNIYKTESGIWDYSPKKYWYESGEVDFYAYAPAGISGLIKGLAGNGSSTTPPILEYELYYDRQQEDLLVAIASYPSPQTGVVNLNFRHAFSRVTGVEARMATKNDAIRHKIKSAELVMSAKGKLRLDKNAGPTWENFSISTGYPLKLKSPNIAIDDESYTALMNPNDAVFLIPQPAKSVSVRIIYDIYNWNELEGETLNAGDANKVKNVQLPADFVFEAGKQYIIHIEL